MKIAQINHRCQGRCRCSSSGRTQRRWRCVDRRKKRGVCDMAVARVDEWCMYREIGALEVNVWWPLRAADDGDKQDSRGEERQGEVEE